jgi:acyl carrier protein
MTTADERELSRIEGRLIDFIEINLGFIEEDAHLRADEPLLGGVLDSLDMLRMVRFIRDEFGVHVRDEDLVPENFKTIRAVAEYVREQLSSHKKES